MRLIDQKIADDMRESIKHYINNETGEIVSVEWLIENFLINDANMNVVNEFLDKHTLVKNN